jgi:hypothetical protein
MQNATATPGPFAAAEGTGSVDFPFVRTLRQTAWEHRAVVVAIAVLMALLGWRVHWFAGVAYTVFAALIFLGSVHLAFHYAVDGYVAAAMVFAIWYVAGKLTDDKSPAGIRSIAAE